MTNQEAIEIIKSECYVMNLLNLDRTRMINSALDKAVEALEAQADIDAVIAKIESMRAKDAFCKYPYTRCIGAIKRGISHGNMDESNE